MQATQSPNVTPLPVKETKVHATKVALPGDASLRNNALCYAFLTLTETVGVQIHSAKVSAKAENILLSKQQKLLASEEQNYKWSSIPNAQYSGPIAHKHSSIQVYSPGDVIVHTWTTYTPGKNIVNQVSINIAEDINREKDGTLETLSLKLNELQQTSTGATAQLNVKVGLIGQTISQAAALLDVVRDMSQKVMQRPSR